MAENSKDEKAKKAFELLRKGELINRGGKYFAISFPQWIEGMEILQSIYSEQEEEICYCAGCRGGSACHGRK